MDKGEQNRVDYFVLGVRKACIVLRPLRDDFLDVSTKTIPQIGPQSVLQLCKSYGANYEPLDKLALKGVAFYFLPSLAKRI